MQNISKYLNIKDDIDLIELNIMAIEQEMKLFKSEKEKLTETKNELSKILNDMKEKLKNLKGIEQELFYEIVINGLNVTKAVDKVAFHNDVDSSTIWKRYYKNVKKELESLENSSENPV